MSTFAIIESGGKQYKVAPGDKIKVEKLDVKEGESFVFENVLLAARDGKIEIGAPFLNGAKVHGRVLRQGKDEKKIVFRYHSKTRHRKKKGHRQPFTEIEIVAV